MERSNGALQGLIDAGFTPVSAAEFQVCDFYRDRARAAMTELLVAGTAYDCVIRNNDAMALGVIDALRDALFHLHHRRSRYDRVTRRQADKIKQPKGLTGLAPSDLCLSTRRIIPSGDSSCIAPELLFFYS